VSHVVKVDLKWLAAMMVETGKDPADIIAAEYERGLNAALDAMEKEIESSVRTTNDP
jgi:hypothetical protein